MALNDQQQLFVDHYVNTLSKTEAARLAGYAVPEKQGSRLAQQPEIKAAIKTAMAEAAAVIGIDENWVMSELLSALQVAKAEVSPVTSASTGKPIKDSDGNPVFKRNEAAIAKYLELIAKSLGMFKDSLEITDTTPSVADRDAKLERARALVAQHRASLKVVDG